MVIATPAGNPSRIATRAWPWDSPAVIQRSTRRVCHRRPGRPALGPGPHHGGVGEQTGWAIEASSLRAVLTDRHQVAQSLPAADPLHRLFLLGLLGEAEQALAEGRRLLDEPATSSDPWQLLLRLADLHCLRSDFAAAERCHQQAWRHALGRERQANTLHSIGVRQFEQGDRDAAAASFQLALTLLSLFGDSPARARTAPRWPWCGPAPESSRPSTR